MGIYVLVSEPIQARGLPLFVAESILAPCAAKVQPTFLSRNALVFSEKYGELLIYGLHSDHENWFKKNVFNI